VSGQHSTLCTANCQPELAGFYAEISRRDPEALRWLLAFHEYAHEVDDLEDGEATGVAPGLRVHQRARVLYSMPFYVRNSAELGAVVDCVTHMYADSNLWARSEHERHRAMADVLRFAGNLVVLTVARLCGWGWEQQRLISPLLWDMSWRTHHDGDGKAH
jgi:hypothetical protein